MYSTRKKREQNGREDVLKDEIEILEKSLQDGNTTDSLKDELDNKKEALENIYSYQAQGAYVRSRAAYKIDGEKPTRLFCSLEKFNGVQKYVPQLIVTDKNGIEGSISDQKEVEKEIFSFYSELFNNKDDKLEIESIEDFLEPSTCHNIPKLSEAQKSSMGGKITLNEMTNYLKKCKNNVAPGSTGFTNEFFKFFWRDIKLID